MAVLKLKEEKDGEKKAQMMCVSVDAKRTRPFLEWSCFSGDELQGWIASESNDVGLAARPAADTTAFYRAGREPWFWDEETYPPPHENFMSDSEDVLDVRAGHLVRQD